MNEYGKWKKVWHERKRKKAKKVEWLDLIINPCKKNIIFVEIFRRWWFIKFILTLIISAIFTLQYFLFYFHVPCSCVLKCKQFEIIYLYHIRKYHQFLCLCILQQCHTRINLICNVDVSLESEINKNKLI